MLAFVTNILSPQPRFDLRVFEVLLGGAAAPEFADARVVAAPPAPMARSWRTPAKLEGSRRERSGGARAPGFEQGHAAVPTKRLLSRATARLH